MDNVNDTYFDGHYKDIWRAIIPGELTAKEVDYLLSRFQLKEDSQVLDMMCGYGRHAIGLARKGIRVTAVDNLRSYIEEINKTAVAENLPLTALQAGALTYQPAGPFDLAVCMGNSLNFFNASDTLTILNNIAAALKPGGCLLINTWSLAEIVVKQFSERTWARVGDMKILTEARYLLRPARMETETTILAPDGSQEVKEGVDYIFSLDELEALLKSAGLELTEVYSVPGRKPFALGDMRAYLIAVKKA